METLAMITTDQIIMFILGQIIGGIIWLVGLKLYYIYKRRH